MVTAPQAQLTSWIEAAEDDLNQQAKAFLLNRLIRGLAPGTLRFYRQKLALFQTFGVRMSALSLTFSMIS